MRRIDGNLTPEIKEFIGNQGVDVADAYPINSYRKLVEQMAKLSYLNKDYLLFFRGQGEDYRNKSGASTFYPVIYRGEYLPRREVLHRFELLEVACQQIKILFTKERIIGHQELARKRYIQWGILQHYEVCSTPLLDFTHSLRVACSFAQINAHGRSAYVYIFGFPYITNRISINSEHDLVNIRLLSIAPPDALRPYFQEGYLSGTEDITADYSSKDELDFKNRLIAKFCFPSEDSFWGNGFQRIPKDVLYPENDRVGEICNNIKLELKDELLPGELGEFIKQWTELEKEIINWTKGKIKNPYSIRESIEVLEKEQLITQEVAISLQRLRKFRNEVVHQPDTISRKEIKSGIMQVVMLKDVIGDVFLDYRDHICHG